MAINLPRTQVAFLRRHIGSVLAGVRQDLKTPERLAQPDKARDEAGAYRDLMQALRQRALTLPNEFAHQAVTVLAAEADRGNEYERVVFEHDALHGLRLASFLGGQEHQASAEVARARGSELHAKNLCASDGRGNRGRSLP